jgi:hypothetical protein
VAAAKPEVILTLIPDAVLMQFQKHGWVLESTISMKVQPNDTAITVNAHSQNGCRQAKGNFKDPSFLFVFTCVCQTTPNHAPYCQANLKL